MRSDYRGSTTNPETRDMTQTPRWLFDALDGQFFFELDAAALPETALCELFIAPEQDALTTSWGPLLDKQRVRRETWAWLNPPYSNIGPWVDCCEAERQEGIGTVMLVPCDPSAEWYRAACQVADCLDIVGYHDEKGRWHSGRVNFIDRGTGKELRGNPKGSTLFIFRPGPLDLLRPQRGTISKGDLLKLAGLPA